MYSRQKVLWTVSLLLPMILCVGASAYVRSDDDVPEVTARVARVTFVSGDVQIRRSGSSDWEKVTVDLPVVEGDEVVTGSDARAEIQLDSFGHLRLNKNSVLRVSTFKDEGVALSLSQGTLSIRLLDFDKSRSFLEIDAPKTTIAIQKAGIYRIDAGSPEGSQVRITATESGEARVYSDNSGFSLKNGRSSTINIEGDLAGEWETTDAAMYADDFDNWALDRDVAIAKKLKDAYYDKYYDRDVYGAEDLNDYGEWVHTKDYGYVWKPYQNSISGYADWSPYRYGEWRWVPPFGWTWVNDEPWGWATYHHGRWFYDDGFWYWSPYGYYRNSRSWWTPALVVLTVFNDDYCWYPLPYNARYYDCNRYFHRDRHNDRWRDNDRRRDGTRQPPLPVATTGPARMKGMPYDRVPVGGVVTTPGDKFGTGKVGPRRAPPEVAKGVLDKDPGDEKTIPRLPKADEVATRQGGRIRPATPIYVPRDQPVQIGVIERKGSPVDDELKITRVMDRRPPPQRRSAEERKDQTPRGPVERDTGAVGRPVTPPNGGEPPQRSPKRETPRVDPPLTVSPGSEPPRRSVEPRQDQPKEQPRNIPPPRTVEPRPEPPKREPRSDTSPKQESPRSSPPTREQPRNDPPARQEQPRSDPPQRSQPKEDSKPSSPEPSRKKDG